MCIIFCIAVVFGGEEILPDGGDAGGGSCEEGGEVGCHIAASWHASVAAWQSYAGFSISPIRL